MQRGALWPVRLTVKDITFSVWECRFDSGTGYGWFVGVTANIADCRSVAMGSTPVRTAIIAAFQWLDTPPGMERMQVRVLPAIQACSPTGRGNSFRNYPVSVRIRSGLPKKNFGLE